MSNEKSKGKTVERQWRKTIGSNPRKRQDSQLSYFGCVNPKYDFFNLSPKNFEKGDAMKEFGKIMNQTGNPVIGMPGDTPSFFVLWDSAAKAVRNRRIWQAREQNAGNRNRYRYRQHNGYRQLQSEAGKRRNSLDKNFVKAQMVKTISLVLKYNALKRCPPPL